MARSGGDDLDALKTQLGGGVAPPPARADELDALRTRVEGAAAGARPPAVPAPSAGKPLPPDQLPPGHILDERLMVVRKIGEGGMGVVYEAIDTRTQARYAVKLLSAALAQDAAAVDAMAREVAAAQAVTHQNLLKVNYFADSGPYKYLVMEYLDGSDLATHLARRGGRLAQGEALGIARQVAAGLDHLHERGLVHLDVKPQNVFVSSSGEARVLDYGISSAVRAHAQGATGEAGSGTLAYMAPEQLRGEGVDRRADVYAFGLVLSQLLTGALPFDARSKKEVVAWHVDARHQAPAVGDERLDRLIVACLSVDPANRPLSLGKALEVPPAAPRAKSPVPAEKPPQRTNAWKRVLVGGVVVAAGIAAWWAIAGRTQVGSSERTGDPAAQAAAERDFAQYTSRCDAGDLRGCVELGELYDVGRGVLPNATQAKDLFIRACDGGNLRGCARLGGLLLIGRAVAIDPAEARRLYVQACDGGELLGCSGLGASYEAGVVSPRIYARARQLYERACNGGEMTGCSGLGIQYFEGYGISKNYERARQFFEQACNGGDMTGCRYLGVLYGGGDGVPKDIARSLQFFEQACSGGEMGGVGRVGGGCYMLGAVDLGDIYDSVPKDSARARQLFARACDAGMRLACEKMRTIQAP